MQQRLQQMKLLARLSFPLFIVKVGIPLRGFVITWLFMQLGSLALSAGALTYTLFTALITFFLGVLMASVGVFLAYAAGEENHQEINQVLQQGLWLGLLLSVPAMFIMSHVEFLLLFLGQSEKVAHLAGQLGKGLAWIFIPYTLLVCIYKLFANLKKSQLAMYYSVAGLCVAVVLSYALSVGFWIFPTLGIKGIGWGLALSYWLQALSALMHVAVSRTTRAHRFFIGLPLPNRAYLKKLWRLGWPMGSKYAMGFFLFFIVALLLGLYDPESLGVYQIILQFFMLTSSFSSAIGLGTEVLLGQAIGGKQIAVIKSICEASLLLAIIGAISVATMVFSFPTWIHQHFFVQGSLAPMVLFPILLWVVLFQFFDSVRSVTIDMLVTFKDSKFPFVIELIGLWVISLPLAYALGVWAKLGLSGFLLGLVLGVLVSVAMSLMRLRWRLFRYTTVGELVQ